MVDWLDVSEYPFASHYFELPTAKMHYVIEGNGDNVVMVHGTPSWSYDFRNIIKTLIPDFRCLSADHIGFGLSEKPDNYTYTLKQHIDNFALWVNATVRGPFHLIVHDFGGPIAFAYALQFPEKIKSIICLNTWMWSVENEPSFNRLKKIFASPVTPFLYKWFNFSPKLIMPLSFGSRKLSKATQKQYTKPFSKINERMGPIGFVQSILNDQPFFDELWQNRNQIAAKPWLLIWGMQDKILGPSYLEKFISFLPHAQILKLHDCGHFPQEEESEAVSYSIKNFLKSL